MKQRLLLMKQHAKLDKAASYERLSLSGQPFFVVCKMWVSLETLYHDVRLIVCERMLLYGSFPCPSSSIFARMIEEMIDNSYGVSHG